MDGVKPWQLAVIIIGLVGGLGLLGWQIFGGEKLHTGNEIVLMDVMTGDRFVADVSGSKTVILPEKHPETGAYTLLPITEDDAGRWYVKRLNEVSTLPQDQLKGVADFQSGLAAPSDAPPRKFKK